MVIDPELNSEKQTASRQLVGPPGYDTHFPDVAIDYFGSNSDVIDFSQRFEKLNKEVTIHV